MPRYIVKIKDRYFDWSTVVDAPVTYGMTLERFREYYRSEYGSDGMRHLDDRLERVEAKGTSSRLDENLKECIGFNRAGENEKQISISQIYKQYAEPTK
jgi:hypothetical protein